MQVCSDVRVQERRPYLRHVAVERHENFASSLADDRGRTGVTRAGVEALRGSPEYRRPAESDEGDADERTEKSSPRHPPRLPLPLSIPGRMTPPVSCLTSATRA